MRFVWNDGYTVDREIGKSLVGLFHNGKQPHVVVLTAEECDSYMQLVGMDYYIRYKRTIINALDAKGNFVVDKYRV